MQELDKSYIENAVAFHGHLCPMFALGLRMGSFALELLGRERESGVKMHAIVEYRNCLADGLQYACGTTFGKINLHYKENGKFAASFIDLSSGKAVRIRIKNNIIENALEYGKKAEKVKRLPVNEREREAKKLFEFGKSLVDGLMKKSNYELFDFNFVDEKKAKEELEKFKIEESLEYGICENCGELFLITFSQNKKCRACKENERQEKRRES